MKLLKKASFFLIFFVMLTLLVGCAGAIEQSENDTDILAEEELCEQLDVQAEKDLEQTADKSTKPPSGSSFTHNVSIKTSGTVERNTGDDWHEMDSDND